MTTPEIMRCKRCPHVSGDDSNDPDSWTCDQMNNRPIADISNDECPVNDEN